MIESIKFGSGVRCRTVVRRSNARSTGKYPSWKTGRVHQFESTAERNAFRLLDCDPSVLSFIEQPCVIRYWADGTLRTHFPDILVQYRYLKELWEVKTLADAQKDEVSSRTEYMERTLPAQGYAYRLITAESLSDRDRLRNQELLLTYGRAPLSVFARSGMLSLIRETGGITWAQASEAKHLGNGRATLCRLVLEGLLSFDPSSLIGPNTTFELTEESL